MGQSIYYGNNNKPVTSIGRTNLFHVITYYNIQHIIIIFSDSK